ncbi:hypothetical protein XELAEV_18005973mg [Xenopus laevis]|uniref:Uncharacterized protein n=1 Tax=Xenopus laevis TaxID=8355 RepID=A0A974DY98_XENLA|nr:hypothetical protein XELAEV_18005973mg [Xenopus laevis]
MGITELHSTISQYIWKHRRARQKFDNLTQPKVSGGLGFPDFWAYHKAAILQRILDFYVLQPSKLWIGVVQASYETPLDKYLWLPKTDREVRKTPDPIMTEIVDTWESLKYRRCLLNENSRITPILHNKDFTPGLRPINFKHWTSTNSLWAYQLLNSRSLKSMADILPLENTTPLEMLCLHQIRHFLAAKSITDETGPEDTLFEQMFNNSDRTPHEIAKIYKMLICRPITPILSPFFLLHSNEMSPVQYKNALISILITVAKSLIPLFWKSNLIPTLKDWALKVNEIHQFESCKVDITRPKQQEKLALKWFHWTQFLESPEYLALVT